MLGVHRSGTSALAGALTELGYFPGADLVPAVEGVNNSGFFEDQRVVDLNDAVLALHGQDWRWPLPLPADWQDHAGMSALRSRARALIEEQASHKRWLLKDPRLCQTLPMWLKEMTAVGVNPHVLMTTRDGREVSASLSKRDSLPAALAETIWLNNLLDAEANSRALPRRLLKYAALVDQPKATLQQLIAWLGIEVDKEKLQTAAKFVSPSQRHNKASSAAPLQLPAARELNVWLDTKVSDGVEASLDQSDAQAMFDSLLARQRAARADLQGVIDAQAKTLLDWETEFAGALTQLEEQKTAAVAYADNAEQSADAAKQSADAAKQQYSALKNAMRIIDVRDTEATARDSQIQSLTEELHLLRTEASAFRDRAQRVLGDMVLPPADSQSREQTTNDYKGLINLQVENNAHTRAVRYLREEFQDQHLRVLEVGCSEGYFGAVLKDDGHEVWGIETNAIAADIAASELDLVYRDSIEAFLLEDAHLDVRFDAIIFGDVLEHLLDPARVLRAVSKRLTDRGVVIASVPNVAHERVRMMLLEGRWDYSATGIMDNTHLHFFTRDTLVDLFSSAAMSVERMSAIELPGDAVQIDVSPATEASFAAQITDRERHIFQFLVMVKPAADNDQASTVNQPFKLRLQRKVLCLPPAPESTLYTIRINDPLQRYTELFGGEFRLGTYGAPSADDIAWADTVVLQREVDDQQLALVESLQAAGKSVVFDIDDYLLEPPEYLSVYDHCVAMRPKLETMLQTADAVSASTQPLLERLRPFCKQVFLTPNYAWSSTVPIQHSEPGTQAIRILVASSDSVRVDFLVPALQQIQANHNVELVGIGPPGEYLQSVGLELTTLPLMNHAEFKAYAASRDNTIALIPLDANDFNGCKSAIKYFDYALAGVPCVCSDCEPYITAVAHNHTGLLVPNDTQSWVTTVSGLLDAPQRRTELADAARQRVLANHNMNLTAAAWDEVLRAVRHPAGDTLDPSGRLVDVSSGKLPDVVSDNSAAEVPRSKAQLARGTVRHALKGASWASAWQIYKKEGFQGLREKWKLVF